MDEGQALRIAAVFILTYVLFVVWCWWQSRRGG